MPTQWLPAFSPIPLPIPRYTPPPTQNKALHHNLRCDRGPLETKRASFASATPYPPTDYSAVLSAMVGLTSEFGMGSGDPHLHGRARKRC